VSDSASEARCSECGRVGRAGLEIIPYAFEAGADRVWLCWAGAGPCFVKAWEAWKAARP